MALLTPDTGQTQTNSSPDLPQENSRQMAASPKQCSKAGVGKGRLMDQTQARQIAKNGLIVSMGVLAVSGFIRNRTARKIHIAAGFATLGLSFWHYSLYPTGPKKNKADKKPKTGAERV